MPSHLATDGYRAHNSASRGQFNGKWTWEVSAATRLDTAVNILDQDAFDQLGLTRPSISTGCATTAGAI